MENTPLDMKSNKQDFNKLKELKTMKLRINK